MSKIINNLGTRLFQSVTDKAGDLGEKFEEEFSRLSFNLTAEVDTLVSELVELSMFIKVTLVLLCILIVVVTIRYLAFGCRATIFKARDWLLENAQKQPPQVILLMPQKEEQPTVEMADSPTPSPPMSPYSGKSAGSRAPIRSPQRLSQQRRSVLGRQQSTTIYADPVTTQNIENIKRESLALFHNQPKIEEV